jgi:hypothetical protein
MDISGRSSGYMVHDCSYVSLHTGIVYDLVDVVCRNARLRSASGNIQHFTC